MLRSLLREPLLHFLLIGTLLFALDAWLRPTPGAGAGAGGEILVSEGRIRNLVQSFRRTWQRSPTGSELDGLVQDYIREEVLYREAKALGLDQDDTVIRRRLRQKIEFVSDDAAALDSPSEQDLADWLAAHPDAFRVEPRATFAQIYLDPRRHGDGLEAYAKRVLDELNRSPSTGEPPAQGDGLLLLEPRYADVSRGELRRIFGTAFADALFQQPVGRWMGPIDSGYGSHLVRIESMTPGGAAKLEEVRALVERDWANTRRKELGEAFYGQLRSKYRVTVKMPEPFRGTGGDGAATASAGEGR
jgi:PPIC-type PPIASE domain